MNLARSEVTVVLRFALIFSIGIGFLSDRAAFASDEIPVNVGPWGEPIIEYFDPNNPDEVPDDIPDNEDAVAVNHARVQESPENQFLVQGASDGTITVIKINEIKVNGVTVIKLPDDADDALEGHELGHDSLIRTEYAAKAEEKIEAAMKGFIGMKFQGTGATLEEKLKSASAMAKEEYNRRARKAERAIVAQQDVLEAKYDKLTDHGRGTGDGKEKDSEGKVKPVTTEVGIDMTLKEQAKAPKAGETALAPVQTTSFAIASEAMLNLDGDTGMMSFDGPLELSEAFDPGDPILDGPLLTINPMQMVGLLPNGSVLIADTALQITDPLTDILLMDAFLFELAFMPSSYEGFDSMIQGFLDVPPVFADGITPGSSDFLNGMLAATDAGELTMFYMFFNGDLPLDQFGNFNTSQISGIIKMSTAAVPVPASLPLFISVLAALGVFGWRRHQSNA
jgi:hypothetical protein